MTAAFSHPESRPDGDVHMDVWVVVAEFARPGTPNRFGVADLDDLIAELAFWQPAGLWSDDRYAVQLHIAAPGPHQALRVALGCHRQALQAAGLASSSLLRVEVLTAEELERGWTELEPDATGVAGVAAARSGVHCPQVYAATRALLAAATASDIAQVVDDFVAAIGARVQPGPPRHTAGMTDVDLAGHGGPPRHATAEAFSMAGLLLEHALPNLISDARQALTRLQALSPRPRDAPLLELDAPGIGETR